MWLQEHAFISGKALSCNLWATTPQRLSAAHGGWAVLAASAVPQRRLQHAPTPSGSGEKDINATSWTFFLSYISLSVISFSGHPADESLHQFLARARTRWAIAALYFYSALLNLQSSSLVWSVQRPLTLSVRSQGPQRPSTQTQVDARWFFLRRLLLFADW